jgi:hypothetical protein
MKKPTLVVTDGRRCRIAWPRRLLGRFKDGYGVAGDHVPGLIRIGPGQLANNERVVLMHELLHELFDYAIIGQVVNKKDEEFILNNLDSWLVALLRENPELVTYLTA